MKNTIKRGILLIVVILFVFQVSAMAADYLTFKVGNKSFNFSKVELKYSKGMSLFSILAEDMLEKLDEEVTVAKKGITIDFTMEDGLDDGTFKIKSVADGSINVWWPGETANSPEVLLTLQSKPDKWKVFRVEIDEILEDEHRVIGTFEGMLVDENGREHEIQEGKFEAKLTEEK